MIAPRTMAAITPGWICLAVGLGGVREEAVFVVEAEARSVMVEPSRVGVVVVVSNLGVAASTEVSRGLVSVIIRWGTSPVNEVVGAAMEGSVVLVLQMVLVISPSLLNS